MKQNKIAVFIDSDNIQYRAESFSQIKETLSELGELLFIRAYGNSNGIRSWLQSGASLFPQDKSIKNSADMSLTIDVMDALHTCTIDTYVLMTDDCDFLPLVARLKLSGKKVIIYGTSHSSKALLKSTEHYYCEDVLSTTGGKGAYTLKMEQQDIARIIDRLIKKSAIGISVPVVLREIRVSIPDFSLIHHGHTKMNLLIQSLGYRVRSNIVSKAR